MNKRPAAEPNDLVTRPCEDASGREWDELVATCGGTLFHRWAWLDLLQDVHGLTSERLLFVRNGSVVGCFPILLQRRARFRIAASPLSGWATPYLGPLFTAQIPRADTLVAEALRRTKCDYSELTSFDPSAISGLGSHSYIYNERKTFVVDLRVGEARLWENLHRSVRRSVKKATKAGMQVIQIPWGELRESYIRLGRAVYAKSRRKPAIGEAQLDAVAERFGNNGVLRIFAARLGKEIIGAKLLLTDRESVYWWDGVSSPEHRSLSPHAVLNWETLRWAANEGLSRCDCCGANDPRIAEFKRKFGGELHSYSYAYRSHSLRASIARHVYRPAAKAVRYVVWRLSGSR